MRAGNVPCDGEAEPSVALVLIARVVEPHEGPEHLLAHVDRNAGAVVVDIHGEPAMVAVAGDRNLLRKARRVRNEVREAAAERRRPYRDDRMPVKYHVGLVPMAL